MSSNERDQKRMQKLWLKQSRVAKAAAKAATTGTPDKKSKPKITKPKPEKMRELPTFWSDASCKFPDASDEEQDTLIFLFAQTFYLKRDLDWQLHKSFLASRLVFSQSIANLASTGMFRYEADDDMDPNTSLAYALLEAIGEELGVERCASIVEPLTASHEDPVVFIRERLPLIERIVNLDMILDIFEESSNPGVIIITPKAHEFFDYLDQKMCNRISAELVANGDY